MNPNDTSAETGRPLFSTAMEAKTGRTVFILLAN